MRLTHTISIWSGLLALGACGTLEPAHPFEIPISQALKDPCERLPIPAENQLPALAQDPAAAAAQLTERRYWGARDLAHEGVETRLCRSRDEAVAVIGRANQVSHETD